MKAFVLTSIAALLLIIVAPRLAAAHPTFLGTHTVTKVLEEKYVYFDNSEVVLLDTGIISHFGGAYDFRVDDKVDIYADNNDPGYPLLLSDQRNNATAHAKPDGHK